MRSKATFGALFFFLIWIIFATLSQGATTARVSAAQQNQPAAVSYDSYQMIEYHLPNGSSDPWSITTDAQGRVWFVQQQPPALVMFNPSNQNFSSYTIPANGTEGASPESVAIDNSGNVWFSLLIANKLGELRNGSSSIIEYSIPGTIVSLGTTNESLPCGPTIIKTDTSGNVWISCEFSNQIDEFFPKNSTFLSFDLPIWMSAPAGFAFDKNGTLWFTAADTYMIGKAVLAELRNGTSDGITEFPPINSTYSFTVSHETGPAGTVQKITSSLPNPSGIAISSDGSTLWITEHIDSSFDSYNINTKSLVRYWTSQTYDKFGYSVSFPNAIAIDSKGDIWIGEHYGNKIAEFDPYTDRLIEYPIPCCSSEAAGPYSIALGPNGTVWFVEIAGSAIGELKPTTPSYAFSIDLLSSTVILSQSSSVNIPLVLNQSGGIASASLNVSGISDTGILTKASASFAEPRISFSSENNVNDTLVLKTQGLSPGIYYLTVSATVPSGEIYSTILKVNVTQASSQTALYTAIIGVTLALIVVGGLFALSRRPRRSRMIRKRR
ncbi:MAG: SMP-30/gluconolactonase/LRE family protein [archaeon]|nr:SMP-30/gluconolactonase/LRE family protein [archaeon]